MLSMFRTTFFLPSANRLFTFSRSALLSSPSTIRPSSATTVTPSTSRCVIFKATFFSSSFVSGSVGNLSRSPKAYPVTPRFAKYSGSHLVVVRAGHIVAAFAADEFATPRFQPTRADRTKSRRVAGHGLDRDFWRGGLFCRDDAARFAGSSRRISARLAARLPAGPATKTGSAGTLGTWFHGEPFI